MFGYVGSSYEDIGRLYEALKMAARNDQIAASIGHNPVHGDGWGCIILDSTSRIMVEYHSGKAIFAPGEEMVFPKTTANTVLYAIFHARQASVKRTINATNSHPFCASNRTDTLYLAQNGALSREWTSRQPAYVQGRSVGSELALEFIVRRPTTFEGIAESTRELQNPTASALDLLILKTEKKENKPSLLYKQFYKKNEAFYMLYRAEMAHGSAIVSSTLKEYGIDCRPVGRGTELTRLDAGAPRNKQPF
jgi:predicted glutamine amidotransferase